MAPEVTNLEQLLDQIAKAAGDQDRVFLGTIVEAIGSRSFGPLLLIAGAVLSTPLSGIPGMPTTMAMFVLLIAVQMLFGRKHFWIPRWLLKRSIARSRLCKVVGWLNPPARFIDRWLRPRLTIFVRSFGAYVIAIICVLIAAGLPPMELIPFSAKGVGLALTAFGLSLVADDGFLALIAFAFTAITFGLVVYAIF